jgi:hypothetical protein
LIQIKGLLPPTSPTTSLLYGDTLLLYGMMDLGATNYIEAPEAKNLIYSINLKTRTVQIRKSAKPLVQYSIYQTLNEQMSRYSVFGSLGLVTRIFDRSSGTLYYNLSGPSLYDGLEKKYKSLQDSILSFLVGDQIYIFDAKGNERVISIPEYIKLYCTEEFQVSDWSRFPLFAESASNKKQNRIIWILIVAIVFTWIGFGFYYFRNSIHRNKKLQKYYELLDNLDVDYRGVRRLLDGDYSEFEMDIILKIEHLPKTIKNVKRNQLLFEINEQFPGYIEKVPDFNKKSAFIYRISKQK